jgi:membrane-bound inhibitor of C-type lysozyme
MGVRIFASGTVFALALVACSDLPLSSKSSAPPGSKRFEYKCADGTRFDVLMYPAGDQVKLELGGVMYELKQVRTASGAKFSDGTTSYWSKGRDATIERGGKVMHRDCATT